MSNLNKEYIQTLSRIVEKIKKLQNKIVEVSEIEKNPSFIGFVNNLENLKKNTEDLKRMIEGELEGKILGVQNSLQDLEKKLLNIIENLKKEIEMLKFIEEKDKESNYKTQKLLSEIIVEIKDELRKLKEELKKYVDDLKFTKEGLLKSPGIIGPSASGFEILLNDLKRGVYSKLNLVEGNNITFEISENKPEGRINIKINSQGGGGGSFMDAIIYAIALG